MAIDINQMIAIIILSFIASTFWNTKKDIFSLSTDSSA